MRNNDILLFFLFFLFFNCSFDDKSEKLKDFPDFIQENYVHYIYKNDLLYLKANIIKMSFFEKKNVMICDKIYAEVYSSKKELVTVLDANIGYIDLNNNILQFADDVVMKKLDQDTTIYTDEINLNYKTNKLYSDKNVLIKKDGSEMKASSLVADLSKMKIEFNNIDLLYKYKDSD